MSDDGPINQPQTPAARQQAIYRRHVDTGTQPRKRKKQGQKKTR